MVRAGEKQKRGIGAWLMDALFPRFCVCCEEEGDLLCRSCSAKWKTAPLVHADSVNGVSVFGMFSYADPIARRLLQVWKYGFDERAWDLLRARMQEYIPHMRLWVDAVCALAPNSDPRSSNGAGLALIPVPLFYTRYNERGFDQSLIVARAYAALTNIPCKSLVQRLRATAPQAQKTEAERQQSYAHNPFALRRSLLREASHPNALVVDDVYTTGATMRAVHAALARHDIQTQGYLVLFIGK